MGDLPCAPDHSKQPGEVTAFYPPNACIHMPILQHGHEIAPGLSCNDRKWEVWKLPGLEKKGDTLFNTIIPVQVYVVPKDGFRGAEADGFKIVYKNIAITSRDLDDLRRKATNLVQDLTEEDHQKVLVVKTGGSPSHSGHGDEFGIVWEIGWRVKKYNIVYSEDRSYMLSVENYDEPDDPEMESGFRIGSKPGRRGVQHNKTAVIPWTQEREDILKEAIRKIGKMRDSLNATLLRPGSLCLLSGRQGGLVTDRRPVDMRVIKLEDSLRVADSVRDLTKQASGMPLSEAVSDLALLMSVTKIKWALCGGLAVGVHARPRGTDDVDLIISDESSLDVFFMRTASKFKKTRDHAMTHKLTGVEIELLTPSFIKVNPALISKAIDTALPTPVGKSLIPVVSRKGLVALKLARGDYQDITDIVAIIRTGGEVDLTDWPLSSKETELFEKTKQGLKDNPSSGV